jgi:hypothetical protein
MGVATLQAGHAVTVPDSGAGVVGTRDRREQGMIKLLVRY